MSAFLSVNNFKAFIVSLRKRASSSLYCAALQQQYIGKRSRKFSIFMLERIVMDFKLIHKSIFPHHTRYVFTHFRVCHTTRNKTTNIRQVQINLLRVTIVGATPHMCRIYTTEEEPHNILQFKLCPSLSPQQQKPPTQRPPKNYTHLHFTVLYSSLFCHSHSTSSSFSLRIVYHSTASQLNVHLYTQKVAPLIRMLA